MMRKAGLQRAILELKNRGCELIIATGGMSVDPDDQTPGAIKASGARVISYGAPVLPGAMFCLAYFEVDSRYGSARLRHVCGYNNI